MDKRRDDAIELRTRFKLDVLEKVLLTLKEAEFPVEPQRIRVRKALKKMSEGLREAKGKVTLESWFEAR